MNPPFYCCLGRLGDLIIIFPALAEIHRRTGVKPIVAVSKDYASLFDGISYAEPRVIDSDWHDGVPIAVEQGAIVVQCKGKGIERDFSKWPNYMACMFERIGFTAEEMRALPLVFDRRDIEREERLAMLVQWGKPVLLYNLTAFTSPFRYVTEVGEFLNGFSDVFNVVDIGSMRADRIYDLLGLMDRATCLVTVDTATLHLAAASKIPFCALIADGWDGSTRPSKGNCQLSLLYSETFKKIRNIAEFISGITKQA